MNWFSGLEGMCRTDVLLSEHTWYGLGGPARWFFSPENEERLGAVVRRCIEHAIPWRILGRGANIVVRDAGFAGAVITLEGQRWETIAFDNPRAIAAGAGADFPRLVRETIERGFVGLENLAGIPGSVGGVVRMNAGGRHGSISQYVEAVQVLGTDGVVSTRSAAEIGFGYRTSKLDGGIVTGVSLRLERGDADAARVRYREIWNEKYTTQPPVSAKSAGCIFKNPPGQAAGKLIDQAGLKGTRRGGAEISTRHANFILAYPGAKAQDVIDLIELARERVQREAGVALELEVEIW
jgi:UDP-N-acetylmuramate dehydrogenase